MLILSRKIDEKIKIGNDITITLIDVHVFRQEVFDAIQSENKAAVVDAQETGNEKAISAMSALSKLLKK